MMKQESGFTTALRNNVAVRCIYNLIVSLHIFYISYIFILWYHHPDIKTSDIFFVARVLSSTHLFLFFELLMLASVTLFSVWSRNFQRCYILLIITILLVPHVFIYSFRIHELPAGFMMMEQVRYIFKAVSVACETEEKVTLKSVAYFLMVPTLIYKSEYPVTKERDWRQIIIWLIETIVMMITFMLLLNHWLIPEFSEDQDTTRKMTASFVIGLYQMMIIGYVLLHVQQNVYAELLCFTDRRFYENWMVSLHPLEFARRWNIVVHTFIHKYVYRKSSHITGSKHCGLALSFLISFMLHDYILNCASRIFFPYFTVTLCQIFLLSPLILCLIRCVKRCPRVESLLSGNNIPFITIQLFASSQAVYCYAEKYYEQQ